MNVNDLPAEVLCIIFDHLYVNELKVASLVCRRWSKLTFNGRRMDRVLLNIPVLKYWEYPLTNFKRNYRNVRLQRYQTKYIARLLHTIKPHIRMLDIECYVSLEQLKLILLEVPKLQHLTIGDYLKKCKTIHQNSPKAEKVQLNRPQLFSFFRMNIPHLRCLRMRCSTDFDLDAWKILSGQLKLVHVDPLHPTNSHRFFQLSFPRLEDFAILEEVWMGPNSKISEEMCLKECDDFFRRHSFLQRLSLPRDFFPKEWAAYSTRHCRELTHLDLCIYHPDTDISDSLMQLRKLKHLSLHGIVKSKLFRGAMSSLESVDWNVHICPGIPLENLFEVAPRLRCLKIRKSISCDDLQLICEKFSCLRRLELRLSFESAADDSVRFDELMHLQELTIETVINLRSFHRNNVRCFTMRLSMTTDDDLYQIPQKFPLLKRLVIIRYRSVSEAAIERLHTSMPSCTIDFNPFYPVDDVTAY